MVLAGGLELSKEKADTSRRKRRLQDSFLHPVLSIISLFQIPVCIFFYNWANLDVLLYLGWTTFVAGIFLSGYTNRVFRRKGGVKKGRGRFRGWGSTRLVDSGLYAVARHPLYLGFILLHLSWILISQHWLSVAFGVPRIVYIYFWMREEEQELVEEFGDKYKRYMQEVPRMNILLGYIRLERRRKGGRQKGS